MIVFVESNFVLELVLSQEDSPAAMELLELAEAKRIQLCVPAFSLVEPRNKLVRERGDRRKLRDALEEQVVQMARSAGFSEIRAQSNDLLAALASKSDADMEEHKDWLDRILKGARVLPLTSEILTAGLERSYADLDFMDAFVYASIEACLKESKPPEAVFANRDARGFMQQSVLDDLHALGCRVIPKFSDALAYVGSRLGAGGSS